MRLQDNGVGYLWAFLRTNTGTKKVYAHRAVALAFIPNPDNKPCVNHIDNNPKNNTIDNLEWCTKAENTAWMVMQGRNKRTNEWLQKIREANAKNMKAITAIHIVTGEVERYQGVNITRESGYWPSNVCMACKTGKIYRHRRWMYTEELERQHEQKKQSV
jgi:hypothetical protein